MSRPLKGASAFWRVGSMLVDAVRANLLSLVTAVIDLSTS